MTPPDDAASLIRLLALMVRMTGLSAREVSAFSWREIRLWLRTQETEDAAPVSNLVSGSVSGPGLAPTSLLGPSIENTAATQARSAASPAERLLDARVVSRGHEASRADPGRGRARSTETQAEIRLVGHGASGASGASARPPLPAAAAAGRANPTSPERHPSQMQTFVAFEPQEVPRQLLPAGEIPGSTPGATGAESTPTGQASREPPSPNPSFPSPNASRENAARENASVEPVAPIGRNTPQGTPQGTPDRRVIQLDIRLDEGLKLEQSFSDTAFGTDFDDELDVTIAPLGHFGGQ